MQMKSELSKFPKNIEMAPSEVAPKSFFDRITERISLQSTDRRPEPVTKLATREALLLLQNYEESRQGWFWSTDDCGNITYITESLAAVFGKHQSDFIGVPFFDLFEKPGEGHEHQRTLPFIFAKQSGFNELPVKAAIADDERWWSISGKAQFNGAGVFTGYRGNGTDITAQRRADEDTSRLAMFDSLTGLANRAAMSKLLDTTLSTFKQQKRTCAVLLLDLDRFKQVNDTLGHPAGDQLLKHVALRLTRAVDKRGTVSRIGGDEFQILLPDCDDRGRLGALADNIIASLSQPYSIEGSRCIIGASIGIAISPFDGMESEDLIRGADLALYAAKGGGRGRFRFFSRDLQQNAEDRRILEEDLRDALTKGEISLAYQPIVNAKSDHVRGVEALMRWVHHDRGPISPALFIPIAEDANLIKMLGEWALERACQDAVKWDGGLRVAVNVSPIQFADENLPKIVRRVLEKSGLAADRLELEITESVFLEGTIETEKMFKELKDIGVRLALDDFGTGYSSLSYLQTAPFDKIKIDQSFVRGATLPGSRNSAIIAAIVALAEALNMETTAEGIEALDELAWIRELNVSHVQGYVYSKAVTHEELLGHVASGEWVVKPTGPARHRCDRISLFRKARAIHDNHCYDVMIRNMSSSGALMEGLVGVPKGTQFVIDFGDGQLALATVRRSIKHQQGVEFEEPLVSDGNGGLCTSRRVSPYNMAAAGLQIPNIPPDFYSHLNPISVQPSLPAFQNINLR